MLTEKTVALTEALPKPLDLSHHLSSISKNRSPAWVKSLYKYFQIPGAVNLAGGLPNAQYFPFDTLEADVARPNRYSEEPDVDQSLLSSFSKLWSTKQNKKADTDHITVQKYSKPATLPVDRIDLETALQYGTAQGYPALMQFINEFTKIVHGQIPYDQPDTVITCGSTDGINKVMMMLTEPGDHLLVEQFAFGTALSTSKPWGVQSAPVAMDHYGMLPEKLEELLATWDPAKGKRPHIMYTIAVGQNPTGGVLPLDRKKQIYKICQKYDVIIMEDEPYWYIQFDRPVSHSQSNSTSRDPYIDSLTPSYLTLDTDGRVIRMDTFSKTVCPGSRAGWITAQPLFIERILRHSESSTQGPSGFVQSMLISLIKHWGTDGWIEWIRHLRDQYQNRRDLMIQGLEEGFTSDGGDLHTRQIAFFGDPSESYVAVTKRPLATYVKPAGGMFLWLRIDIERHPKYTPAKKRELMDELWIYLAERKIVVSPSWIFATSEELAQDHCEFFRMCFAAVPTEDCKAASVEFGRLVRLWFAKAAAEK